MILRTVAALLIVSWLAVNTQAETVRLRTVAYERCETGECQQVTAYATGVTIGRLPDGSDGVLTVAHSYRGLTQPRTTVTWFGGIEIPATIVAVSKDARVDAAVLSVRLPQRPKCYAMVDDVAENSDCWSVGCSDGRKMTTRRGKWRTGCVPGVVPRQGESGGPVFVGDGDEEIAGIIVGYDSDGMVVQTCRQIRSWMTLQIGYLPQCQPVIVQPVTPVIVAPRVPRPTAPPPPREAVAAGCDCAAQIAELRAKVATQAGLLVEQQNRIKAIEESETTVHILDAAGRLIDKDKFPINGPIELRFESVNQQDLLKRLKALEKSSANTAAK